MYILINYTQYHAGHRTMAYKDFKELKADVINNLDINGWNDKNTVDLRSLRSCLDYITKDSFNVTWRKSSSYKKFMNYRYGLKSKAI